MQPGALRTALPAMTALLTALALPGLVACNGPSGSSAGDGAGTETGETDGTQTGDTLTTDTITTDTDTTGDGDGDVCGDGVVGESEMCDDGNTMDGDGCPSTCQCAPEESGCGSYCADLASDPANCGACELACEGTSGPVCVLGVCQQDRAWQGVNALDDMLPGAAGPGASVAMNAAGDGVSGWQHDPGSGMAVYASRYDHGSDAWSAPVNISGAEGVAAEAPSVSLDDAGSGVAVWVVQEAGTTAVYEARLNGTTGTWRRRRRWMGRRTGGGDGRGVGGCRRRHGGGGVGRWCGGR